MVSFILNSTNMLCSLSSNAAFYMNSQTRDQRKPFSAGNRPIAKTWYTCCLSFFLFLDDDACLRHVVN